MNEQETKLAPCHFKAFENWINENCYMNGGKLKLYGKSGTVVSEYLKSIKNEKQTT